LSSEIIGGNLSTKSTKKKKPQHFLCIKEHKNKSNVNLWDTTKDYIKVGEVKKYIKSPDNTLWVPLNIIKDEYDFSY
jgi:hypothetical protein